MKKIVWIAFICLSPFPLLAHTDIDSLINVLNTQVQTNDGEIQLYWDIATGYWNKDIEKTLLFAGKGLDLSEKAHDNLWAARFSRILGFSYIHKNENDSSLYHLKNAVEFAIKAKDRREENIATVYMGSLYLSQGKYEPALNCFMGALPSLEDLAQHEQYANTLINIATIYKQLYHIEKALAYANQALAVAGKYSLIYPEMAGLELMGDIYYEKRQFNRAVSYMLKAYEISRRQQDNPRIITNTQMLANAYCALEEYDEAEKYANECLELASTFGNKLHEFMGWSVMWNVRFGQKRYKESERYASKMWEADSSRLDWALNAALNLCYSNIFMKNAREAGYFLDKYTDIKNQLTGKELNNSLAAVEVKYETEKKQIRITALEEERKLYAGLGIAIVTALLAGSGFLFYYYRSQRRIAEQHIKQLGQEKELIAARSALYAEKAEREMLARDLHDGVGAMLSVVKNNMDVMKSYSIIENAEAGYFHKALDVLDKSITELRRVAHHIMPATLIDKGLIIALDDFYRSIPEVEFHYTEAGSRFDAEKELVLYRCAYELVNNALRHAAASRIDVHLTMNEKTVYLSVVDNGCGFDPHAVSMGMGMNNMFARLSAFGGRIDIYSEPGKGSEVNIELDL
ncbi:MAG: tetratricopeptide repeat protein [Tannerellaceae bacterium]|jgi:signal transduction histidine kinase|nr:tetratricopeptide repeat protein [Tannerellaceae bacterium]